MRQEQRGFDQQMVRGIKGDIERSFGMSVDKRHAKRGRDDSHLADAGIGQNNLGVSLGQAEGDAVKGRQKADGRQRVAPAFQRNTKRQEADQPDHAGLDARAAQHRRDRNRRGVIGQRHPAIEWNHADLHSEAGNDQPQRRVAPG